jgi:hypothetical protein
LCKSTAIVHLTWRGDSAPAGGVAQEIINNKILQARIPVNIEVQLK